MKGKDNIWNKPVEELVREMNEAVKNSEDKEYTQQEKIEYDAEFGYYPDDEDED